jgi:hypothetical protein
METGNNKKRVSHSLTNMNKNKKVVTPKNPNFGVAEFKVVVEQNEVKLIIHGHEIVARCEKDVYEKLFDHCRKVIENSNQ